jgi:hypothetical protein
MEDDLAPPNGQSARHLLVSLVHDAAEGILLDGFREEPAFPDFGFQVSQDELHGFGARRRLRPGGIHDLVQSDPHGEKARCRKDKDDQGNEFFHDDLLSLIGTLLSCVLYCFMKSLFIKAPARSSESPEAYCRRQAGISKRDRIMMQL